jgi:hypothetical protein
VLACASRIAFASNISNATLCIAFWTCISKFGKRAAATGAALSSCCCCRLLTLLLLKMSTAAAASSTMGRHSF